MILSVGQQIEISKVKSLLSDYEYTMRGDIIDIHLPNDTEIARVMFNDDVIENIKIIDARTMSAVKQIKELNLTGDIEFTLALEILEKKCPYIDFKTITSPETILPNYNSAVSILVDEIKKQSGKTILLFVGDTKTTENFLRAQNIKFTITNGITMQNEINIIREPFPVSFGIKDLLVYSLTNINTGKIAPANIITKAKSEFIMPLVGECVVHSFHGIGRFTGVKAMNLTDKEEDYFVIQYDGGTMVYLPTDKVDMLSNYVGEPTRLHKIGGQDFANAKQRVRRRLRELSFKLSELYRQRAEARRNEYQFDPEVIKSFSESFIHTLTKDQQKALNDIYNDLSSHKIMDRLLCGDVGYGKTEVAFRTAFLSIMNGHQVVFLCPTTILSVQHYNNAKERFAKFGIKVAVYNRFISQKEQKQILHDLESGEIDLIIGTHKLLSLSKHNFKNLGLLILDEEQRFGVESKEKIKKITPNIDVLTMTATPIPRTLNLSLIGFRDISIITTPPKDRLPVITKVVEFSWDLLYKAIQDELDRNGQIIILYNTVKSIKEFTAKISSHFKKTAFIHGQMPSHKIEQTIEALYEKEIDIIVSSTIIENGIDLTTANTLFVVNADKLGLAQMHQLRGRVGRGNTQAFAYFTFQNEDWIKTEALERMNSIKKFYSTGAGFNIAMRDLEIRGSGEVLGANQSGHINEIGMEAFAQILSEIAEENRTNSW